MKKKTKYEFITKFFRNSDIMKIDGNIKMLGKWSKYDTNSFIFMRIVSTILVFILTVYIFKMGYLFAPFIAIIYYYLFYYINIDRKLKNKIQKLDNEALYFFEILTLTLESGKNLENALETTCNNINSEIADEFKQALLEIKFGKSLVQALDDMKKRIPSESVNNIILNITQTSIFGNSILDTMYNQIEFLRDKRLLEIKGQINKIPNKISIISVIFMLPIILLLILGPIIVNIFG